MIFEAERYRFIILSQVRSAMNGRRSGINKVLIPTNSGKKKNDIPVTSISKDVKSSKSIKFDYEDDKDCFQYRDTIFDDEIEKLHAKSAKSKNKAKALQDEDDVYDGDDGGVPEEVSARTEDIQKLRELHEQMMLPAEKRAKKRKGRPIPISSGEGRTETGDEELDDSILAVLDSVNDTEESKQIIDNEKESNTEKIEAEPKTWKRKNHIERINKNVYNSRKMYVCKMYDMVLHDI